MTDYLIVVLVLTGSGAVVWAVATFGGPADPSPDAASRTRGTRRGSVQDRDDLRSRLASCDERWTELDELQWRRHLDKEWPSS